MITTPPVPANPFDSWQLSTFDPAEGFPLVTLLQAAIGGTVDDETSEHAEGLFAELHERGLEAWRESALILDQFLLCGGHYGMGRDAATLYLNAQPAPSMSRPALSLMNMIMAAFIGEGRAAADTVLAQPREYAHLTGAVRFLFCTAAGASGYPKDRFEGLLGQLCAGVL